MNNKLRLEGYKLFNPSLDECVRISNNIYNFRDDLVLKRIRSLNINQPSSDAMREILPFYDIIPHNCIIRLKGYAYIDDELYLVLQNGGKSLKELIQEGSYSYEDITRVVLHVCLGLIHMHQHNYVHRDIKPANIVVSEVCEAKLVDFGISRPISSNDLTHDLGTRGYYAPEVACGQYDFRSDIYSLGVVILRMIKDCNLDDFINGQQLYCIPRTTQIILRSMLSPDPSKRPTLDEICILILNDVFYFALNICDFEEDRYKDIEDKQAVDHSNLFDSYFSAPRCRADYATILTKDESFIFHYGIYKYYYVDKKESADLLYVGHFLGDQHCSFMIDCMMFIRETIAFDVEKSYQFMNRRFLSLPPDDFKNYLVLYPQQLERENYRHEENDQIYKQINRVGDFEMTQSLVEFFSDFEEEFIVFERRLRMNKIAEKIPEIMRLLQMISSKLREWNVNDLNFYYLIVILYQFKVDIFYLKYYAKLTYDKEFIDIIEKMFEAETIYTKKDNKWLKKKMKLNPSLADMLYLNDYRGKYNYLFRATDKVNVGLKEYYALNHYMRCDDLELLRYLMFHMAPSEREQYIKIIKSTQKWNFELEFIFFWESFNNGKYKEARESNKRMVTKSEIKQDIVIFFMALMKFGDGDKENGLINLSWVSSDCDDLCCLWIGLFYFHGYQVERSREHGLSMIKKAANKYEQAKYELAMLYIQGVFVQQDIELALKYLPDKLNRAFNDHQYFDDIRSGFYYMPPIIDSFLDQLTFELLLSEDFTEGKEGNLFDQIIQQDARFFRRHAELQNPLAMYCYAHMIRNVDEAIHWLEESLMYEFKYSYNELAYLYFVYTDDIEMAMYYSEIGAKLGFVESQFIYRVNSEYGSAEKKFWDGMANRSQDVNLEIIYTYFFEDVEKEYIEKFRLDSICILFRIASENNELVN